MNTLDSLSCDQISPYVDSHFIVITPADMPDIKLKLLQVNPIISNQVQENFSLIFEGPLEPMLNQQIYDLEHEQLGSLSLFMVQVARNTSGMQYEVVFNRLL